jgi:hypothetical protein
MKYLLLFPLLVCHLTCWAQGEDPFEALINDTQNNPLPRVNENAPRAQENTKPTVIKTPTFACEVEKFDEIAGVNLYDWSESKSFYFFETKMSIDADGSPRAYHPQDKGLDKLEYAGRQGNWWALVTDNGKSNGNPIIQKEGDPYPGYYISMTATVYRGYPDNVPQRYIDAEKIPYFVLNPYVMNSTGTQKGDIGYIYNRRTKKGCYAILGDVGSNQKLGEGSMYLAQQLGINNNPRNGGQDSDVVYMVFPFSGNGVARPIKEINEIGEKLMKKADGFSFIKNCLPLSSPKPLDLVKFSFENGETTESRNIYFSDKINNTLLFVISHPNLITGSTVMIINTTNNKTALAQVVESSRDEKVYVSPKVWEKLGGGNITTPLQVNLKYRTAH